MTALRGDCECGPCRRRLDELAGAPPAQMELSYEGESPGFAAVPATPERWVPLPQGLAPALPAGVDALTGSLARHDVLARAASTAEATRQLLACGLAVPAVGVPGGVR